MEKNVRQIRIPTKRELLHQIYPGNDEMSAGPYSNHLRLRLCVGYSLTLLQVWIMFDEVMSSPPAAICADPCSIVMHIRDALEAVGGSVSVQMTTPLSRVHA